jgi:predicted phage terminase large subunit-like protein
MSSSLKLSTEEESAAELLARRSSRGNFSEWCRFAGFEPASHHLLLCGELEALSRGETQRLAIFWPPGSAKSTYASMLFPPWYLGQHPSDTILATSHTYELAEHWGRRARNLVDVFGKKALGYEVDPATRSAGLWLTTNGGQFFAAGVGGAIAGWRADLGIIDDPVRSREDAESKGTQQRNWNWYKYDFIPRLKPQARRLLIQTRWSEGDLAGMILEDEGKHWRVITLPMEAEDNDILGRKPGERLWSTWFTEEMVAEAKRDPRVWAALYQQRPAPDTGDFFQRRWLHPVKKFEIPPVSEMRIYGASDYSTTSTGRNDYTVHVVMGIDTSDRPWILDLWRQRATTDLWIETWCRLVKHWKPMSWAEERGQILSGVGPFLDRRSRELHAYTDRQQFTSRFDKGIRAQSFRGYIATIGLWYDEASSWREEFEHEMLTFPASRHDDIVDAMSLCGQMLDYALMGARPKKENKKLSHGYKAMRQEPTNQSILTL